MFRLESKQKLCWKFYPSLVFQIHSFADHIPTLESKKLSQMSLKISFKKPPGTRKKFPCGFLWWFLFLLLFYCNILPNCNHFFSASATWIKTKSVIMVEIMNLNGFVKLVFQDCFICIINEMITFFIMNYIHYNFQNIFTCYFLLVVKVWKHDIFYFKNFNVFIFWHGKIGSKHNQMVKYTSSCFV